MALTQSNEQVALSPVVVAYILLSGQTAAIGSTPILSSAPAGVYRANYSLVLTTTGTSGNLVANVVATDDAQAETIAAATIAAITAKGQANGSIVIQNTASANISYTTTFSGTIGAAVYSLYIILERIF